MTHKEHLEKLAEMFAKNELDILESESEFQFACTQCGKCCHDREDILLSPHDFYHLVRETGKEPQEIIDRYTNIYVGPQSHLTVMQLRYREELDGSTTCYFLGQKDGKFYCRIQESKPFVCRAFPLGRLNSFEEGKEDDKPLYFLQPGSEPGCKGAEIAQKDGIMQKVVDWLGGEEKKQWSDRYAMLFKKYSVKLLKTINFDGMRFIKSKELINQYYNMMFTLFYLSYDFQADEESFLTQYEENWKRIIDLSKSLAMHPSGKLRPKLK